MKKLKFFALALVAAFGMASCGDEEEIAFCASDAEAVQSTVVMGGKNSDNGSFYTFDKGVQTKGQLGNQAGNVIFCFSTLGEDFQFISGTVAENEIVNTQASETKFAVIGEASVAKASKLNESDFKNTEVKINRKLENGRKAVAFMNDKCKGFFEITNYDEAAEDLSMTVYIIK